MNQTTNTSFRENAFGNAVCIMGPFCRCLNLLPNVAHEFFACGYLTNRYMYRPGLLSPSCAQTSHMYIQIGILGLKYRLFLNISLNKGIFEPEFPKITSEWAHDKEILLSQGYVFDQIFLSQEYPIKNRSRTPSQFFFGVPPPPHPHPHPLISLSQFPYHSLQYANIAIFPGVTDPMRVWWYLTRGDNFQQKKQSGSEPAYDNTSEKWHR